MSIRVTRRDALRSSLGAAALASLPRMDAADHAGIAAPGAQAAAAPSGAAASGSGMLLSLGDYEALAQQKMSHVAWEFYDSGSGDETTVRWNREALRRFG